MKTVKVIAVLEDGGYIQCGDGRFFPEIRNADGQLAGMITRSQFDRLRFRAGLSHVGRHAWAIRPEPIPDEQAW